HDGPQRLQPGAIRHVNVHQHDVGLKLPRHADSLPPGGRLTHHAHEVRARLHQAHHPLPEQTVIVGNEHAEWFRFHGSPLYQSCMRGSHTSTRVPCPGLDVIVRPPPTLSAP